MEYIWEYRHIILWAVIAVLSLLADFNNFKSKITALMLDAKKLAKDGVLKNGEQQVEWIVLQAYQKLPKRYQIFNENTMRKIIKWLYDKAMDYLDDGMVNNSTETIDFNTDDVLAVNEEIESVPGEEE